MTMRILLAAVLGGALTAAAAPAATITGGVTTVDVTADLAALGLGAGPFGGATVADANGVQRFSFGITGGRTFAGGAALIEHEGSGVSLGAAGDPPPFAAVSNFLIDTAQGTVFGDFFEGPSDVALFSFGTIDEDGIDLLFTSEFAAALSAVFGAPDLTGAVFGVANTAPEVAPIPLPAGALLLASALLSAAMLRRRRA